MTSRALLFIVALGASMPALAQTPVVKLTAADKVDTTILSPRGDRIAAVVGKDRVAVWTLPNGGLLQELKLSRRPVSLLFVEPNQIILALADGAIEVRSLATGALVRSMDAGGAQSVLAGSADGRLLASSGAERIRLWDSSGTLLHTFGHEFGGVATLAFSPDAMLLASAGFDTQVHLWDVSTGQQKLSVPDRLVATFAVTFTADGKQLVIGGANGAIEILDVQTGSTVRRLRAEKYAVGNVSLSPDGRSIGAAYFDVNGMTLPAPLAVAELASGKVVRRLMPGALPIWSGFSNDGRLLYAIAKEQELTLWALSVASSSSSEPAKRK